MKNTGILPLYQFFSRILQAAAEHYLEYRVFLAGRLNLIHRRGRDAFANLLPEGAGKVRKDKTQSNELNLTNPARIRKSTTLNRCAILRLGESNYEHPHLRSKRHTFLVISISEALEEKSLRLQQPIPGEGKRDWANYLVTKKN